MAKRTKLILFVMALVSILGLAVATNAWFVTVNATPPGKISSALVHYLPDGGGQTIPSILKYGNLVSGNGADPDGTALVLPGDSLLPLVTTEGGTQTVRTSIARLFEEGETVDTLIHWEIRANGGVELTSKQRDLMRAGTPVSQWYKDGVPLDTPPSPTAADYIAETTTAEESKSTTAEGFPATQTTLTVTTVYTPRKEGAPTFQLVSTTVNIIVHEPAKIAPADQADLWDGAAQLHSAVETVIFVQDGTVEQTNLPTRSILLIRTPNTVDAPSAALPLMLENRSTVETNVRIGLNARVTPLGSGKTPFPLETREKNGTYYLGATIENHFIELLAFRPADGWVKVAEQGGKSSPWALWDFAPGGSPAIPAISPPVDAPDAPAVPVRYPVTDSFRIISESAGLDGTIDTAQFELLFNRLYCEDVPTITIHLSYYVRQHEFMDWTEFYSQDLTLDMGDFQP